MGKTKKQSENSAWATLFDYVYYSNKYGNCQSTRNEQNVSQVRQLLAQFYVEGIARTQSPTNKNDAVELSTFGIITGVNLT